MYKEGLRGIGAVQPAGEEAQGFLTSVYMSLVWSDKSQLGFFQRCPAPQ